MSTLFNVLSHLIIWPLKVAAFLFFLIFSACLIDLLLNITSWCRSWQQLALISYCFIECVFFLWFNEALVKAQKRRLPPASTEADRIRIWNYIKHAKSEGRESHPYNFLCSWFSVNDLHQILRVDLSSWLAWALFDRKIEEISRDDELEIEKLISTIESEASMKFAASSPKSAPVMRLSIDDVEAEHRPLLYYLATGAMDSASDLALYLVGFRCKNIGSLRYWIINPPEQENTGGGLKSRDESEKHREPVVFVHGVGMGLVTYLPFIMKLRQIQPYNYFSKERSRPCIILVELPYVSMKLLQEVPSMDNTVGCIAEILKLHKLPPALFVGHSLGSFVVAAVLRQRPEVVKDVVLIDPVCFLLWEAALTRNFIYRQPTTPMQRIQYYHISRELSINYYFHRHFWWHKCVLLPQDLPKGAKIFVSEVDDIYDTNRVIAHLKMHGFEVSIFKEAGHGRWILDAANTSLLLSTIQDTLTNRALKQE